MGNRNQNPFRLRAESGFTVNCRSRKTRQLPPL